MIFLSGKYIVLGSSGMMGSHLLGLLKDKKNISVKAIYFKNVPRIKAKNITPIKCNLLDYRNLKRVFEGADYVINFAGQLTTSKVLRKNQVEPVIYNLKIFLNVIKSSWNARVKKFFWLSSTTGYLETKKNLVEEDMFKKNPPSFWYGIGWMTRYCETLCEYFSNKIDQKMTSVVLRPSFIYGEYDHFDGDYAHFLPMLIKEMYQNNDKILMNGNGAEKRNFVYAGDVAYYVLLLIKNEKSYRPLNFGGVNSLSIKNVAYKIAQIMDYNKNRIIFDNKVTKSIDFKFSTKRINDLYGPLNLTNFDEGIKKTVKWYKLNNR